MRYMGKYCQALFLLLLIFSCESRQTQSTATKPVKDTATYTPPNNPYVVEADSLAAKVNTKLLTETQLADLPDSAFVELLTLDTSFVLDMKYATSDNFLKTRVYDCAQCLLRAKVAKALAHAQQKFKEKGYRIKLYDCYRPLDVQKQMWKIKPDDRYVGNPYGNGSVHNKGAAVDLTLVNSQGEELDMGTPFDYFGREAHHAYTGFPQQVLDNRKLLKQTLEESGFQPITSEWWHYSYRNNSYPVANFKPSC